MQHRLKIAKRRSDSSAFHNTSTAEITRTTLISPERNPSTICTVRCLFHSAVTCYYKNIHSLCFSTRMQPGRDSSQTSSHSTRQNVKQLWFRKWCACFTAKGFIRPESRLCSFEKTKRPSECDEEKSERNFTIYFINHVLFGTHIIEHKHVKTSHGTLYANLSRVQPACVLSSVLSPQAQALLQRMVLSLQSDKLCRQSSIRTTSCWFLGEGAGPYRTHR